jgi:hypothetical protein
MSKASVMGTLTCQDGKAEEMEGVLSAAGERCLPFARIRLGPAPGLSSGHDITLSRQEQKRSVRTRSRAGGMRRPLHGSEPGKRSVACPTISQHQATRTEGDQR